MTKLRTRIVSKRGAYKYPDTMNFEGKRYGLIKIVRLKRDAISASKWHRNMRGGSARIVGPRWTVKIKYTDSVQQEYMYAVYVRHEKSLGAAGAIQNIGGQKWTYIHADRSKKKAQTLAAKWRADGPFYGPIRTRVVRKKTKGRKGYLYLVYLNCRDYEKQTGKKCGKRSR